MAFGLSLQPISFPARLAIAGALSPLIVPLQFYVIRLLGVTFDSTVWILIVLNLGSIVLIARRWKDLQVSPGEAAAFGALYLFLASCVLFLIPLATFDAFRLYHSHQWMHTGLVYEFPQGRLIPEEPELAGVRLRYPWLGHIFWAILSKALNMPPTVIYVITNMVSLLWICILVYEACRIRGARPFARLAAIIWMALGAGSAAYFLQRIIGGSLHGDPRYVPWLRKFINFELLKFSLAMFAAIILLSMLAMQKRTTSRLALIAILLISIGLVYPVFFPAAAGFVGVFFLFLAKQAWSDADRRDRKLVVGFLAGLIAVGLICLAYTHWLTAGRSDPVVVLSSPSRIMRKAFHALLALSPLLFLVALAAWKRLKEEETLVLLGGAISSLFCYVLLQVTAGSNEYKYVFGVALCLAPVACLALDRWPARVPRSVLVIGSALLFFPAILTKRPSDRYKDYPKAEERTYQLRLAGSEPDSQWTDAVRDSTPPDTILAIRHAGLYLPAVTERSLLGPPEQTREIPGYGLASRFNLVEERGYPPKVVEDRETLLKRIFDCKQDCNPEELSGQLKRLNRPIAFAFYPGEESEFQEWLGQNQRGTNIIPARDGAPTVWLYKP